MGFFVQLGIAAAQTIGEVREVLLVRTAKIT